MVEYNPRFSHRKGGITLESGRTQHLKSALKAGAIMGIGLGAGILSGLLGVGGGFILVPAMVYLIGLSQHQAHGTSLAVMIFIVLLGAITYSQSGQMNWLVAIELAIGGVFGAMIGARLANKLSAKRLKRYFGLLLLFVAARMIYDVVSSASGAGPVNGHAVSAGGFGAVAVLGLGVLTGMLSGLMGVGGGIIMVPAMVYLMGLSQKMAQGISLAVIIPVSISGAIIHAKHGNVRADVWHWLVFGGVAGGLIGARLAIVLPSEILRVIFGGLMIVLGTMMVVGRKRDRRQVDNAGGG